MNNRPVFVVSASRSGSTGMAKLLGTALNASVLLEPMPKFCIEQRLVYKYGPEAVDTRSMILAKKEVIDEVQSKGLVCIDKNPNYIMFFPEMIDIFDARCVVVFRDGRDVVRSFMDWVNVMKKNVYQTHEDIESAPYVEPGVVPQGWEFSFFRPNPGTEMYDKWKSLPLFEKFCWYWVEANRMILEKLKQVPEGSCDVVNWSTLTTERIEELFNNNGLEGFNSIKANQALYARYNSIKERLNVDDVFPYHNDWTEEQKRIFESYAGELMKELGFN